MRNPVAISWSPRRVRWGRWRGEWPSLTWPSGFGDLSPSGSASAATHPSITKNTVSSTLLLGTCLLEVQICVSIFFGYSWEWKFFHIKNDPRIYMIFNLYCDLLIIYDFKFVLLGITQKRQWNDFTLHVVIEVTNYSTVSKEW